MAATAEHPHRCAPAGRPPPRPPTPWRSPACARWPTAPRTGRRPAGGAARARARPGRCAVALPVPQRCGATRRLTSTRPARLPGSSRRDARSCSITPRHGPTCGPAGLAPVGHPPFMAGPRGGAAPPARRRHLTEVRDAAGLAVWDRLLAAGYPMPSPAPPALLGRRRGSGWRAWTASPRRPPLSYTAHGVVDVEAVATLPPFRAGARARRSPWAATLADPALPAVLVSSDYGPGGLFPC